MEIRLVVAPAWSNADIMAVLAKTAINAAFARADLSDTVGIVAGELMENAIKYGDWSEASGLAFSLASDEHHVELEVSCPCDPTSGHYARLLAALGKIESANARESYLERLAQLAQNHGERGGLGLLRLAYEADCHLSARLAENLLHVRARLNIPR